MKVFHPNKFLGLAVGERSLLAAELSGGQRPQVRRLGELQYPEGVSLSQPQALGEALRRFLDKQSFTAKHVVVGLPARWLLVRSKSIPVADAATTRQMLRLGAETEFSSELKDLTYDYIPSETVAAAETRGVLLVAARKDAISDVSTMCRTAGLNLRTLMPQAAALDSAAGNGNDWILQSQEDSTELSGRSGIGATIRHLRGSIDQPSFAGEFLRAVASLGGREASRQVVLWHDLPVDSESLSQRIGLPVRAGELSQLGVDAHLNGTAPPDSSQRGLGRYAPAVALAVWGLRNEDGINLLRSRLAPPKERRVPRWTIPAAAVLIGLIVVGVLAWRQLQTQQAHLQTLQTRLDGMSDQIESADAFVSKVMFARRWHGDQTPYLLCLRDLTLAIPQDGSTYATSLILRDPSVGVTSTARPGTTTGATGTQLALTGQFFGKTDNQQSVQSLLDRLKGMQGFSGVKLGGTQNATRGQEVSFSINFTYHPSVAANDTHAPTNAVDEGSQP